MGCLGAASFWNDASMDFHLTGRKEVNGAGEVSALSSALEKRFPSEISDQRFGVADLSGAHPAFQLPRRHADQLQKLIFIRVCARRHQPGCHVEVNDLGG